MSQLKPSFMKKIQECLSESCFTLNDFSIEFPESGTTFLRLKFKPKGEYQFSVIERSKRGEVKFENSFGMGTRVERNEYDVLEANVCPGKHKLRDTVALSGFDDALSEIVRWCNQIRDDLYAIAPRENPIESVRAEFESQFKDMIDEPEGFFTSDEKAAIDKKFDDIYKRFEELKGEHTLTKQELAGIKKDFDEIKQSASAYPKGIWASVTNNKMAKIVSSVFNSSEGRQFILDQIRKLISG